VRQEFSAVALGIARGDAATTTAQAEQTKPAERTENIPVLDEVKVKVTATLEEGSAGAGYRVETAKKIGPWGDLPIQDAPYTINVIPGALIRNNNIVDSDQLFKLLPNAYQGFSQSNNDLPSISARGFGAVILVDGIRHQGGTAGSGLTLDDMERVEVIPGFTGFLTGGGSASGAVNYVLKRPTSYTFTDVTLGYLGGSRGRTHIDTGGPLLDGRFGYRFNFSHAEGETEKEHLFLRETLASGALDWHINERVLLQLDGAFRRRNQDGAPGMFNSGVARVGNMIAPPNAHKAYGQEWDYTDRDTTRLGAGLSAQISEQLSFRSALRWQHDEQEMLNAPANSWAPGFNPALVGAHDYDKWIRSALSPTRRMAEQKNYGGYAYFDVAFKTGALQHKLTAGYSTSINNSYVPERNFTRLPVSLATTTVAHPYIPKPATLPAKAGGKWYRSARDEYSNWVVGDQVSMGDFIAMLGANHTRAYTRNFNLAGTKTGEYDKSKLTPNVSLIYKPVPALSIYGTYIEALENAGTVGADNGGVPYTNAFQVLEPTTSEQYELGAKATLGGTLLTAALFYIDKANIYDVDNGNGTLTRTQDGRQVHKGFEFTVSGKATERLALYGGFTWLDAEITKTRTDAERGRTPSGVPRTMAKLYAEYRLPLAGADDLYLTGGVYYIGKRFYEPNDSARAPGSTVFDLGARYESKILNRETIFRLNIENLTDRRYWQQVGTYSALGNPRTVTFSVSTRF
jgi:iron complex outermembrane receptor protein